MNDVPVEPYQGIKENFQVIYKKAERRLFAQHHIITSNLKTGKEMKVKKSNLSFVLETKQQREIFSFSAHFGFHANTVSVINLSEHWCCAKDFFLGLAILIWVCHRTGFLRESKCRNSAHCLILL